MLSINGEHERSFDAEDGGMKRGSMRNILIAVLLTLVPGCASLMQGLPGGATARQVQEAERLFQQGKYAEARAAWQQVAKERAGSPAGEQAAYRAARVLVYHKNPSKNYGLAARELEALLKTYPTGKHADDAASWLSLLETMEKARVTALFEQVDALTKKLEQAAADRRKTEAERDAVIKERDALTGERDDLKKRIDALVQEKEDLLKEKTALLKEKDVLAKDRAALEKKVAGLTKDKERLLAAKAKLEQRLRDVTEVDVTMEKKRKQMK